MTRAPVRIEFDPNVRARGSGSSYAALDRASGAVSPGDDVVLYEPEDGIEFDGKATEVDTAKGLVYFTVDWASGREIAGAERP